LESKVFGPEGISDQVKRDLDTLMGLSEQQLNSFGAWLADRANPIPVAWSEIEDLRGSAGLDGETTNNLLGLLRMIFTNWHTSSLTASDVRHELESLKYPEEQVARFTDFLSRSERLRERVYRAAMRRSYELAGLPTIDDLSIVWDLRPVFQEPAFSPETDIGALENLVTQTFVMLLEISASRKDGKRESQTYQLSEDECDRLLTALTNSKRQLEVFKKKLLI